MGLRLARISVVAILPRGYRHHVARDLVSPTLAPREFALHLTGLSLNLRCTRSAVRSLAPAAAPSATAPTTAFALLPFIASFGASRLRNSRLLRIGVSGKFLAVVLVSLVRLPVGQMPTTTLGATFTMALAASAPSPAAS
jgi:hypothetical protein